jgi:hypothetical protein
MDKLTELKKQIEQQLDLCDSTDTPAVCAMKETNKGKNDLVNLIVKKVLYSDNPSIADAIVDIENEFSNAE